MQNEDRIESPSASRVLVVEDDRPTRMLLERIIHARGHEVVGCESAEIALERLGKEFFPLITLDIQLPGMSGLELSRLLRSRPEGSYYYILVGTGNNRPEDLREILEAGADDYIGKPYNPGLLDVRLTVAEAAVKEIARRKRLEGELQFLARHDPLTRLFNRSQLEPGMAAALETAREGKPGVVLYLDLDNFKIINDTLGHDTGDKLLLEVAAALESLARPGDVLVRFGGDEFVLILPDCAMPDAVRLAESIIAKIEEIAFVAEGRTFRVGASIGAALMDGTKDAGEVMGNADAACYAAKARGRNRVEVHRLETTEISQLIADTDWSTRIRDAMRDGSLQLWFQPVVDLAAQKIIFQEVLLRYVDPRCDEPVNPAVFLSAMRRCGQSTALDRFVIAKAFEALALNPGLAVSINISGALFGEDTYCDFVESMLANSGISSERVIFEITENELIPNLQNASGAIKRLQAIGCRFGLDDFGSGFSSLMYLKSLPIDFLKIEGTFIRDLENQPFNQAALRAIRIITDAMEIETVAEFVETADELELVRQIGIPCAQGHFIAIPRNTPYVLDEIA
ncbi:MAG TPA: EAL domain-containing protein, partial [Terrimicrobiaceae bacterium]|nr:EAL domain-containing protein [Terrimicrobiaceae bacterium]